MENSPKSPCFISKSAISMAIFNRQVNLPEGITLIAVIPSFSLQFCLVSPVSRMTFPFKAGKNPIISPSCSQVMNWNILADLYATENVTSMQGWFMGEKSGQERICKRVVYLFACVLCCSLSFYLRYMLFICYSLFVWSCSRFQMCLEMLQISDEGLA